ncbi:MAG: PRC-barrel domain-containing protein [Gemmatimonadaceae bacterium]
MRDETTARTDTNTRRDDTTPRLAALGDLRDYKVADDDPDIRGWDVIGSDGDRIGEVHDVIADTVAMRVRYVDVELDAVSSGGEKDRHVLLPIGCARLHEKDDQLLMGSATFDVATLPAYTHGPITREQELTIRDCVAEAVPADRAARRRTGEDEFYGHPVYDEEPFWGGRREGREEKEYLRRY